MPISTNQSTVLKTINIYIGMQTVSLHEKFIAIHDRTIMQAVSFHVRIIIIHIYTITNYTIQQRGLTKLITLLL